MLIASTVLWLIVTWMTICAGWTSGQITSSESSAEYLENVVNQLNELYKSTTTTVDRPIANYKKPEISGASAVDDDHYHVDQNQYLCAGQNAQLANCQKYYATDRFQPTSSDVLIDDQTYVDSAPKHYKVPVPQAVSAMYTTVRQPEPLDFTEAELAALYKIALERGQVTSLETLTNNPSPARNPRPMGTHLQLPAGHQGYYYYFYPLKSFAGGLRYSQDYDKILDAKPNESAPPAVESKKQMSNPLFTTMSSFIALAMVLMMGIMFIPRLVDLRPRSLNDDFLQLTKFVGEAIDRRNCPGIYRH